MKKRFVVFSLFLFLVFAITSIAHEGETDEYNLDAHSQYPLSSWEAVNYGSIILILTVLIMMIFQNKLNEPAKKFLFCSLCAVCTLVTLYLIITTLHLNITSWSKGPVHWHADYEIWACDKQLQLVEPTGMSNKQGVLLLHSHDDNRIHVEGVLTEPRSASLGAFFHVLGGELTNYGFTLPTREGVVSVENGQLCNGLPATLSVFVNGVAKENSPEYVISHYEDVPPGDRIKIIFTEKPIEQINPYIKSEPKPQEAN